MKTTIISAAFISLITASCTNSKSDSIVINPFNTTTVEGKGPVREKTFSGDFDELQVSTSIEATVLKSNEEKVVISAPSDLLDVILVENNNGKLHIHFKPNTNVRSNGMVRATVYAKDFSKLQANSSGSITLNDKFLTEKLSVDASSSGSVSGDLEANDFDINVSSSGNFKGKIWAVNLSGDVSSSGDVEISGEAKNADFDVSSSGSIDAKNLVVENADLDASSSGGIDVGVQNTLSASASSGGDISVSKRGNLNVTRSKESSGGSISVL